MGRGEMWVKLKNFAQQKPWFLILLILVFLGLMIFINIEVLHFTSKPEFCAKCHTHEGTGPLTEVFTWKKSIHAQKNVACLDCHGAPGFFGYLKAKIRGLYDLYSFAFKGQEHMIKILEKSYTDVNYALKVFSIESCLFCHSDFYNEKIRKEKIITLAGLKFRNLDKVKNPAYRKENNLIDILKDPVRKISDFDPKHESHLKAGISCIHCHRQIAHSGNLVSLQSQRVFGQESYCANCHLANKDTISMKDLTLSQAGNPAIFSHNFHIQLFSCSDCHPEPFKMKAGTTQINFNLHTQNKYCFKCHGERKTASYNCESCHKTQ